MIVYCSLLYDMGQPSQERRHEFEGGGWGANASEGVGGDQYSKNTNICKRLGFMSPPPPPASMMATPLNPASTNHMRQLVYAIHDSV